eukprot:scaffold4927_cov139-Amphora_coffeaeformis.AAC.21
MNNIQATAPLLERPKRPRTAYNYFFHSEREKLLELLPVREQGKPKKGHGKISFGDMARVISAKWKTIGAQEMIHFANMANEDKFRYRRDMEAYKKDQRELERRAAKQRQQQQENEKQGQVDEDMEPIPYTPIFPPLSSSMQERFQNNGSSIADLANQLDKESMDLIIAMFK